MHINSISSNTSYMNSLCNVFIFSNSYHFLCGKNFQHNLYFLNIIVISRDTVKQANRISFSSLTIALTH